MKTILRGSTKEVVIDTEGQVVIIGESINPTRKKNWFPPFRKRISNICYHWLRHRLMHRLRYLM